jgi:hypothetical protein
MASYYTREAESGKIDPGRASVTDTEILNRLESFLRTEDFGKNWDGFYQDVLPTIQRFLENEGFHTTLVGEDDTESRTAELVATRDSLVLRVPWQEDYNGRSLVDLEGIRIGG